MSRNTTSAFILAIAVGLVFVSAPAAWAAPTPIPGGANQLNGVNGSLNSTLFNGKVRVKQMRLRASTATEYTPADGQRGLVFSYLVSNGTHVARTGYFAAAISDADGVTIDGKAVTVYSAFYSLQPGSAARQTIQFILPAGYTPTKILLTDQGSPSGPAFRVNLNAPDILAP